MTKYNGINPVIGVTLMVAITVILAAVIAAFVFGVLGTNTEMNLTVQGIYTKTESPFYGTNYYFITNDGIYFVGADLPGPIEIDTEYCFEVGELNAKPRIWRFCKNQTGIIDCISGNCSGAI